MGEELIDKKLDVLTQGPMAKPYSSFPQKAKSD